MKELMDKRAAFCTACGKAWEAGQIPGCDAAECPFEKGVLDAGALKGGPRWDYVNPIGNNFPEGAKLSAHGPYGGGARPTHHDPVNHPKHYTNHPSGVECIQITRHMGFNLGNAMKYIWRADLKNGLEDLRKAAWYIQDEIEKREAV